MTSARRSRGLAKKVEMSVRSSTLASTRSQAVRRNFGAAWSSNALM